MDLKDHFEHLRTVHFSLIATCLLLLVVSTTSQNLTVKLAENQLSSMQSMVGHWSDLDFDAAIDRQVQASSMQVPRSRVLKFVNPVFVPKPGLYAIDFTMPAWVPITTEQCTPWLYDPMLKRQPRTLADAHEVWDCLHSANSMAIPFAFSAEAAVLGDKRVSVEESGSAAPVGHLKLAFAFLKQGVPAVRLLLGQNERACLREPRNSCVPNFAVWPSTTHRGVPYQKRQRRQLRCVQGRVV